jgi:putative nucleotidyltransferase with HDIG domain
MVQPPAPRFPALSTRFAPALIWLERPQHQAILTGIGLALGLAAILAAPSEASGASIEIGAPSPNDFEAPYTLQYQSEVLTQAERERNAAAVAPVYSVDPGISTRQRERVDSVLANIGMLRASPEPADSKRAWVRGFPELEKLSEAQLDLLIGQGVEGRWTDEEWRRAIDEVRRVSVLSLRQNIREEDLPGVRRGLVNSVDPQMSGEDARLVADIVAGFIVANRIVDETVTEARRMEARASTPILEEKFLAGRTIVREGDIVSAAQYEALGQFGLLPGAFRWTIALADLILIATLVAILAALLARWRPWILERPRPLALLSGLILLFTFFARLLSASDAPLIYAFPAAAVAMTCTVLLGLEIGLLGAILLSVTIGLLPGAGIGIALYVLLGSLAGALVLDRAERLKAFLVAGTAVAAASVAVGASLRLADPLFDIRAVLEISGIAVAQAVLATGLTALGVMAAGSLFGVTTSFQLLELMRPDVPLLRELQIKAPGTYQHSIVLSNLAEAAATIIGADPLLVRAGAYYHDIGKTLRPSFFVENQLSGTSPHEGLAPRASARIIIEHVTEGEKLAREHDLPDVILDFIREHHGTMRVEYFLHQAKQDEGDRVDPKAFTYPGPRPQSRETAILMLADGSEAAVRARNPQSVEEIDEVVSKIIQSRLNGGQLEDSDLTLRDLRRIRRAFVSTLQSMYHPRIQYPEGVGPVEPAASLAEASAR